MKQTEELARAKGGTVLDDPGLVDEVANLVEYPVAVMGSFNKEFLRVPKEVLITAMREHQRYFSVVDQQREPAALLHHDQQHPGRGHGGRPRGERAGARGAACPMPHIFSIMT